MARDFNLVVVQPKELPNYASTIFVEAAMKAIYKKKLFTVALSGGSTPKPLYHLLAELYKTAPFLQMTHIFFADERCVPPDHPDSNYGMIDRIFLSKANVPPENIHRMKGEVEPKRAAVEYSNELKRFFKLEPRQIPVFDLILLGMGENGHTASIFPGSRVIYNTTGLAAAPYISTLDAYRLTLTPPVLKNARHVVFLVSGKEKAETLKQVLEGPYKPKQLPAQLLRNSRFKVMWLVDKDAVSQLSSV